MDGFFSRLRFSLDHRWAPDRMSAYLDQELTERGRQRMERHVGECPDCHRLLAGLDLIVDALHVLPAPQDGPGAVQIAAAVRAQLNDRP